MGEVIAILSGKGGTGKTSLCAGLGCALAELEQNVLCIDLDIGLRNLDIALAMADEPALSFAEVSQERPVWKQAAQHPQFGKLRFLTAPALRLDEQVDTSRFQALLEQAKKEFDFILLDAPAGLGEGFRLAAGGANRCLLVSGGDPASLRDAGRTADVLSLLEKNRVKLIVNRVNEKLYEKMRLTVDDVMDEIGLPLLGLVPEDRNVPLAAASERPLLLFSRRGAPAACRRIAKRLLNRRTPMPVRL